MIRSSDDDANRRSAASFAVTSALCGAAIGGFVLGTLLFVAVPPPVEVEVPMVMLEPSGGGPAKAPPPELPPAPIRPPRTEPDPNAEPAAAAPVEPQPQGGGGTALTPGIGPGTTIGPPGTGDSPDGPPVPQVVNLPHAKLVIRKKTELQYPDAAKALGLGEQRCLATVYVAEDGVPYDVEVSACPLVFHAATRESLLQWRWEPPRDGRSRIKAQTAVGITFLLDR